jgi:hypothetical protein
MSVFVLYFFTIYHSVLEQYFRVHLHVDLYHSTLWISMSSSCDAPFEFLLSFHTITFSFIDQSLNFCAHCQFSMGSSCGVPLASFNFN